MKQEPMSLFLVKLILVAAIITGIGIALLIGATGYFLSKPKIEPQVSSPVVTPIPAPTIKDETSDSSSKALAMEDWKTYRNEGYGFEVKYPENWATVPAKTFQYFYPQIYKFPSEVFVTIMIVPGDPLVPFKDGEKNLKEIFIGERKFYWKEDELNPMVKEMEYYALNSDNSKIAEFVLSVVKDNKYLPVMDIENIFNQMLSTFKFIEKEETADWETFRGEKYKFQIKYPSGWNVGNEIFYSVYINSPDNSKHISITYYSDFPREKRNEIESLSYVTNSRQILKKYKEQINNKEWSLFELSEFFENKKKEALMGVGGIEKWELENILTGTFFSNDRGVRVFSNLDLTQFKNVLSTFEFIE